MSRTPFFGVLVAFVLVASVLAAAGPAAPQAAMNGRIVFVSGRTGTLKMFTVDTTSGATSAFAHGPAGSIDADPAWEPFGSRIAFSRSGAGDETYDLLVRQVGGPGGAVRITDDIVGVWTDRQPAWSPPAEVSPKSRSGRASWPTPRGSRRRTKSCSSSCARARPPDGTWPRSIPPCPGALPRR